MDVAKQAGADCVKFQTHITEKEMISARQPSLEECENAGLEPIYLSYFVPWDSHHNYQIAKKWGFRTLDQEHKREGTLENYNQIDLIYPVLQKWIKLFNY